MSKIFVSLKSASSKAVDNFYKVILDNSNDLTCLLNIKGQFVYASPSHSKVLGYSPTELIQLNIFNLINKKDAISLRKILKESESNTTHSTIHFKIRNKSNKWHLLETYCTLVNLLEHEKYYLLTSRDITKRFKREKKIIKWAFYDALTGLPNRLLLRERLSQAMIESDRNKTKLGILFLDLNKFKSINDTYGHLVGDKVLQYFSNTLLKSTRKVDSVCRQGGDEFIILLNNLQSQDDAIIVCEKIFNNLSEKVTIEGNTFSISTSIGISMYPDDNKDIDSLILAADIAMFNAKKKGTNIYEIYTKSMSIENN